MWKNILFGTIPTLVAGIAMMTLAAAAKGRRLAKPGQDDGRQVAVARRQPHESAQSQ